MKNYKNLSSGWLCERDILTTTNNRADTINSQIISGFQALEMNYFSIDTVVDSEESVHFPTEFFNSQTPSGMPPHKILLKVAVPIILLRNLNSPRLCNGTRFRVTSLTKNLIEAEILTGCAKGEKIFFTENTIIPQRFSRSDQKSSVSNKSLFCNDNKQSVRSNFNLLWFRFGK